MNYRDPQLRSRLAANYASGAMRGAARRRFEGLMAADASLRRIVREWEGQLYPLALSLPPEMPPKRVWHAIQTRLHRAKATQPWGWNGVYLWRLFSGALAALLVAAVLVYPSQVERAAQSQLMAVLQNPQARAMLVVQAGTDGVIRVLALDDLESVAGDRALELWAIPVGQSPQSVGIVPAKGRISLIRPKGLEGVGQLAISLEPPGGSPTGQPTGPIVMSGNVLPI